MPERTWDYETMTTTYTWQEEYGEGSITDTFFHGRIKGNQTVHLFFSNWSTPWCGSGNTRNINRRLGNHIEKTQDEITCKKCLPFVKKGEITSWLAGE